MFQITDSYSKKIHLTYSTFFVQSGGLLMVINTQLVKIVHMISMLNNVDIVKACRSKKYDSFIILK